MSKYITLFDTHANYQTYINGNNNVLPNVSYCKDINDVCYNPYYKPLVVTFNVTDTSVWTEIMYDDATSYFSDIEIDGVVQPSIVSTYAFSTAGEHTVKYTLVDPTTIGNGAFFCCSNLTNITIPNSVTTIDAAAFYCCWQLTTINIPNSVTTIGYGSFAQCNGLISIIIPNSVTSIGDEAFQDSTDNLINVTIGNGVTSIGNYAFQYCSSLTSVTIQAITPPTLGSNAFDYNAPGRKIYVPSESVNAYKAASGWSDYAADIQAIP